MAYDVTCIPDMKYAEGERCKQNRQKHIGPCLSTAFTVDQDNYEDAQYDPSIDEDKK